MNEKMRVVLLDDHGVIWRGINERLETSPLRIRQDMSPRHDLDASEERMRQLGLWPWR